MPIRRWRWPSFKVKTLMAVTAVLALVFYVVAEMNRISPERRWEMEARWVRHPLTTKFLPSEGDRVRPGDPLLKVACIAGVDDGHSWLVTEEGKIGDTWVLYPDAGGNRDLGRAPDEGLRQLPAYLKRLPSSSVAGPEPGSLIIAYRSDGVWFFRRYRLGSVPREVNDIARLLKLRSSLGGGVIDDW